MINWDEQDYQVLARAATSAFYDEGLDDHQWEAFFMGFCCANRMPIPLPIPDRVY